MINKDEIISKLEEEVAMLRSVISIIPGTFYWKDINGRYLGCNNLEAKLFGLSSPEEIVGKDDVEFIGAELAEQAKKNDLAVMLSKQENSFEEQGFSTGKETAVYLTKKVPIIGKNNEIKGILGVSFDITERKQMEEDLRIAKQKAEAANRAKSRFLAMISHELRSPLTSLLGFTKLVEKEDLTSEIKQEYLQHITTSGNYLLSLINSLLDYNKLETNKFELTHTPLNLKATIKDVISMMSGSANIKNLIIDFSYDEKAPINVMSSNQIIRQILINLIGNAIKFTKEGKITVAVKFISTQNQFSKLELSVSDSGIGIPLDEQQSIFKHFYQLGNIYTRNTSLSGTGLGLAIVKKLVKLLGGKIKVESTPGKGSRFFFTANFSNTLLEEFPLAPHAAHLRILIVNDCSTTNYCAPYLTNIPYHTASSKETMETIAKSHSNILPYDIVLIDPNIASCASSELQSALLAFSSNIIAITLSIHSTSEWEISSEPTRERIIHFQTKLKDAWENNKNKHKKSLTYSSASKTPHVLLLEDNKLIQIIHRNLLEELGCKVDIAASVSEAMSLLKNNYDILFVDIGLPEVAGFEFIKTIRQTEGQLSETPIIVITGYSEEDEIKYCLRIGADNVLIKPVNETSLRRALNRYTQSAEIQLSKL